MEPIHEGLPGAWVCDTSGMSWASLCIESGEAAGSACHSDIRTVLGGASRVQYAQAYAEDFAFAGCYKHVMV